MLTVIHRSGNHCNCHLQGKFIVVGIISDPVYRAGSRWRVGFDGAGHRAVIKYPFYSAKNSCNFCHQIKIFSNIFKLSDTYSYLVAYFPSAT